MRLNIKLFNYRRLYIHFCFLALLNIFFSTENIQAKTFSINDIEISAPFEINFDKNNIIDEGFLQAFDRLVLSTVQTKDQNKLDKVSLGLIKGMIETFSIKEEKFIDEVYYLSLNVSFNKKKVLNLMERKNIFPSLPVKKNIFFLPIIVDNNKDEISIFSENYIFNNWNSNNQKYHLLRYILPTEDLEDFNLIKKNSKYLESYSFNEIIKKYNLDEYIISIIFKENNLVKVLNKINFNQEEDIKNTNFQNLDIDNNQDADELVKNLKTIYENYWKSKNEINSSVKISLTISVNNNNTEIKKFEEILDNMDMVYDFYIYKLNNKNSFYKIIYNGLPDHFLKVMKNKRYEFDIQDQIWVLK
ncbi:hypothetical protein OAH45_04120 [Candidatus Pelagibacter sp.]|nr:hypothetical protein [Candidatus Pelagibacter sp.]MDB4812060.1 hypothetical protein [Candidatus Pelagibacter sp.]MDC0465942.1 hypothetical protein [Candidatus Pelagibacter sp.]